MAKMSLELLNNVQHWRNRAEEARIHVEQLTDPEAKRMMLEIAASYDKLAAHAEERCSTGSAAGCEVKRDDLMNQNERRALALLAESERGITEELMLANGFTSEMLADLVLAGLATVVTDTLETGAGHAMKIERYQITNAGRKAFV